MHMATILGVKWQPWSEIGPYRGAQAVVNGQEFAITYPQRRSCRRQAHCEHYVQLIHSRWCRRAVAGNPGDLTEDFRNVPRLTVAQWQRISLFIPPGQ
jgi:hypothetical protein